MRGDARTIRAAMADAHHEPSVYPAAQSLAETVIGEKALFESSRKCWKGVNHKYSAQAYQLSVIENTVRLSRCLRNNTYKPGKTHIVNITYPKKRTAVAIGFRDRVYQRSLNDNALYPQMVRGFVYANCACQRGKGTDAARNLFKAMLHRAYLKYGHKDFYVLSCDVRHYYDTMRHDVTNEMFAKTCDEWTARCVSETLNCQYRGEKGYNPGSQMVQIAGISYLNGIDHYIKECLKTKLYVRYMDDFHLIGENEADLREKLSKIGEKLTEIGMELHPDKTVIRKASSGIGFLGYTYKVAESGRVLVFRDRRRVKEIRRRMRRLAAKIRSGRAHRSALNESYQCVQSALSKGNSKRLLRRMDDFYNNLEKEIGNESRS